MSPSALTVEEAFQNVFQDILCPVAGAELAHDQATDLSPVETAAIETIKAEQLQEIVDLADHLLEGSEYTAIGQDGSKLNYSAEDICTRLFEHDLFPSAMSSMILNKPDSALALQDLGLRCAREVAADALGFEIAELV